MNFLDKIRFAKNFFGVVADPQRTDLIFNVAKIGLRYPDSAGMRKMLKHVFTDAEFKRQFDSQYLMGPVDFSPFAKYPDGTLGKEYFRHMTANNLKADFFPKDDTRIAPCYVAMRLRETHDLWHVLAGYDTSVAGELGLQAFVLGQTKGAFTAMLLAVGFLHVARHESYDLFRYMELMQGGFQQGRSAKFLLNVKYENLWNRTLDEIRQELRIGAPPEYQRIAD